MTTAKPDFHSEKVKATCDEALVDVMNGLSPIIPAGLHEQIRSGILIYGEMREMGGKIIAIDALMEARKALK